MKTHLALLAVALAFCGCSRGLDKPIDVNRVDVSSQSFAFESSRRADEIVVDPSASETYEIGVSSEGVQAEMGKFLLLKREGADAALKLTQRTHPAEADPWIAWDARYECFVFENDDYSHFKKYTGELCMLSRGVLNDRSSFDIDCNAFTVSCPWDGWVEYGDSIIGMARTDKTDINDVNFADPKLKWHYREKPADRRKRSECADANEVAFPTPPSTSAARQKADETGVHLGGVRAEAGKFILLQREGADAALKITEQTRRNRTDGKAYGAKYECFVFEKDDYSRSKKYTGEVHFSWAERGSDSCYIECETFRVEWWLDDWIFYGNSITAMARTNTTDIKDVNFADPSLQWHYRKKGRSGTK
jgi:hypothetical protein